MRSFDLEFVSTALPERVFALLAEAPLWSAWFRPARRVRWLEGRPAGGSGAVRLVAVGNLCEVVALAVDLEDLWLGPFVETFEAHLAADPGAFEAAERLTQDAAG
jgi:hypothetical protein